MPPIQTHAERAYLRVSPDHERLWSTKVNVCSPEVPGRARWVPRRVPVPPGDTTGKRVFIHLVSTEADDMRFSSILRTTTAIVALAAVAACSDRPTSPS